MSIKKRLLWFYKGSAPIYHVPLHTASIYKRKFITQHRKQLTEDIVKYFALTLKTLDLWKNNIKYYKLFKSRLSLFITLHM